MRGTKDISDPWSAEAEKHYPLIYDLVVNGVPASWWKWRDDGTLEAEVSGEVLVFNEVLFTGVMANEHP